MGAFLFTGEDVDKKVAVLSGGERTRLALCILLLSPSNFLILDEPTNHLDILSKDVLKAALINYEGTFIVVSHDREFLDGLTNRIWDIENQGLKIHHFGVQEFLQRKMELTEGSKPPVSAQKNTTPIVKVEEVKVEKTLSFDEQKEFKRKKTQLNNQVKKAEDAISDLELKIKKMDEQILALDYTNENESTKLLAEYDILKKSLDSEMQNWENATEELILLID